MILQNMELTWGEILFIWFINTVTSFFKLLNSSKPDTKAGHQMELTRMPRVSQVNPSTTHAAVDGGDMSQTQAESAEQTPWK